MYKNLNAQGLGVSGRQSELIELALTFGFRGFDVSMERLVKQARHNSVEQAGRYIDSAAAFAEGFTIGGWDLDLNWDVDDAAFAQSLTDLGEAVEVAAKVKATRCYSTIQPGSDALPYHENFERLRARIAQVAAMLAPHEIRLGLNFLPAPAARKGKEYEFIHDFEGLTTLCSTVGEDNVGIVLDTWNWFVGGGGMDQLQSLTEQQIVVVRIADVPGDTDMAVISQSSRILPCDDGLVDCEGVIKMLVEKEYTGPVTPYPHAAAFSRQTRDAIVQAAADCLENLWIAAGLSKPKPVAVAAAAAATAESNGEATDEEEDSSEVAFASG